jgi:hypothetical protein
VSDLTNLPFWNYYVTEVTKATQGPTRVGSRFEQIRKSDRQTIVVDVLEPGRRLVVSTTPESRPQLRRRMGFEEHHDREVPETEIVDRWDLDLDTPVVLEPLAKLKVKKAVADNLGKLRQLLENRSVTLQDGREVTLQER